MAKSKKPAAKKPAAKKPAAKKPAAESPQVAPAASEQDDQIAFVRMRLPLPTPSASEREVYLERFSESECADAGAQTRASEVLNQARRLVVSVSSDVLAHSEELNYAPTRLSYLMDTVDELEQAVVVQNAGRKAGSERRSSLVAAESAVKSCASKAASIFDDMLGGAWRAKYVSTTQQAQQAATPDRALAEWVALGRELLANKDPKVVAMLAGQRVTASVVDAWDASVKAYKSAQHDTQELKGKVIGTDLPATNVIEGRVLLETSLLYNAFVRAKESGAALNIPVLGPSLLRIAKPSARATKHKKAPAAPKKDEPAAPAK